MSYCRFSSDNYGCDIYLYESDNGYVINIAKSRYMGDIPKVDFSLLQKGKVKKFAKQQQIQNKFLEGAKLEEIGLEFDGKRLVLETLEEVKEKLLELREIGYNFPDYVLRVIESEIKTRDNKKQ